MNTVWDSLEVTHGFEGHILFLEEDNYVFPNALENFKKLSELKPLVCPDCLGINLAPKEMKDIGEGQSLVIEALGNVAYGFNRSVWKLMWTYSNVSLFPGSLLPRFIWVTNFSFQEFCEYNEYNWDTLTRDMIHRIRGEPMLVLRGSRGSVHHVGTCGMNVGDDCSKPIRVPEFLRIDEVPTRWTPATEIKRRDGKIQFHIEHKGYGGWGDWRDRELCRHFSEIYHKGNNKGQLG